MRLLREKRGWTQEKAAEVCGIGYKLYQLYELGIKRNPGMLTLEKIAAGYSLDISELLAPTGTGATPAARTVAREARQRRKMRS